MKPIVTLIFSLLLMTVLPVMAQSNNGGFTPVEDEDLRNPDPADWPMWHRNYEAWSYSPLDQINPDNVGALQLAWARAMEAGGQAATPLIYDGVMYLSQPGGEELWALDAATGDVIWEFRRELPEDSHFVGNTSRNIAIYKDMIYHSTGDAHVIAINARTGELVWDTEMRDYKDGATNSSGPIVVRGIVVAGQSCMPANLAGEKAPADCGITALDAITGEILWRRNVIAKPEEAADETWDGVPYAQRMAASAWLAGGYDVDQDRIIWGTSSSRPYPTILQGTEEGDQLYTNSTLALDPDTGQIEWYFQHHPKDEFDLDHPFERILVDTVVSPDPEHVPWINPRVRPGERRQVITGIPGKTGLVWTLDRNTGEFLWARPTVQQNVYIGVDVDTGRPIENKAIRNIRVGETQFVCPTVHGGRNWPSSTYSPLTNAIYEPLNNLCMNSTLTALQDWENQIFSGVNYEKMIAPTANGKVGRIEAVSVETGETLWRYEQRAGLMSLVSTGGGLIFMGDMNRRFKALNQHTGEVVWETILSGPITGYPVSYAVDGRQYVAVAVGGSNVMDTNELTPEIKVDAGSNNLFVFALPRDAGAVTYTRPTTSTTANRSGTGFSTITVNAQTFTGWKLYNTADCARCHGSDQEGGSGPSLKQSLQALSQEQFKSVVLNGRVEKGMPGFGGAKLITDGVEHLYTFLKGRADGSIPDGAILQPSGDLR